MERRELFSSFFTKNKKENKETIIRPPYYKDEDSFLKNCTDCEGYCATSCEENIIIIQDDSTPKIDFKLGGCTYCNNCAQNCPHDVLDLKFKKNIDINIEIDILKCMSWHQSMCFSCKDPCLDDAIEFLGLFRPSIIDTKCTRCGFCVNVCPSDAINIKK
jgi:ferredoxin-type protein NapF